MTPTPTDHVSPVANSAAGKSEKNTSMMFSKLCNIDHLNTAKAEIDQSKQDLFIIMMSDYEQ